MSYRTLRWLNVVIAAVTLVSAVDALVSDLVVPGYREEHRDALWFVTGYCAV